MLPDAPDITEEAVDEVLDGVRTPSCRSRAAPSGAPLW